MKGDEFSGFCLDNKTGVKFSNNEYELISENIRRILTTRKGERVNNPSFGSRVQEFLFMPQLYVSDLIAEIISSIQENEPRVTVNSCTLKSANQDDSIEVLLDVTINNSKEENLTIGVAI
jgi:phage baseplate assembly protein W